MARHGHIAINGHRVDIPSYAVQVGDQLVAHEKSKMKEAITANRQDPNNLALPGYLIPIDGTDQFKMAMVPAREDIPVIVNEQLIVEYYSGK